MQITPNREGSTWGQIVAPCLIRYLGPSTYDLQQNNIDFDKK